MMTAFEVARKVLDSLPSHVRRPNQDAKSRDQATVEIAYWMSRAAVLANALVQYDPGIIEYESWNAQFAAMHRTEEKP